MNGHASWGPQFCAGFENGILLGHLMYKSGLVPRSMAILGLFVGGPLALVPAGAAIADEETASGSRAERQDVLGAEEDAPLVAGAADGEHGSGSFVAAVAPTPVAPDGPGSRAGLPGQFGQPFLLGGDEPSCDFGVQMHAFIVSLAAAPRQ